MTPDQSNAILAVLGIVTTIGAFIGFWWTRYEIMQQRKDTQALAKLTANLDYKVQIWTTELNQAIKRLERASELIGLIHEASFWIIFESTKSQGSDVSSRLTSRMAEFKALARVIGDDKLIALADEMYPTFALKKTPNAPWTLVEPINKMNDLIEGIHIRIYELLAELTARNSSQGEKR
jgi:hypothetical protein